MVFARQFEGLDELIAARPPGANPGDVLDAWLLLGGEIDARGLTMAIWA